MGGGPEHAKSAPVMRPQPVCSDITLMERGFNPVAPGKLKNMRPSNVNFRTIFNPV